jgi:hypothetical protein
MGDFLRGDRGLRSNEKAKEPGAQTVRPEQASAGLGQIQLLLFGANPYQGDCALGAFQDTKNHCYFHFS